MWNGLFSQTTIPVLSAVADFSQVRHTVLAGNLANLDTPGYRALDLPVQDFQTYLKEAVAARRGPGTALSPGDAVYLRRASSPQWSKEARPIVRHDGNDVSVEQQVSEMVKNQILHNTAITIMTNQFRLLLTAISEHV